MNPQSFLEDFSTIANAPGGVQRLREMVLFLALQGKLSQQFDTDSSPEELLKNIQAYRQEKALAKRKSRSASQSHEHSEGSGTWDLPHTWIWVRNQDLFSLRKGKVPKDLSEDKKKFPYLDIEALDRGNVRRFTNDDTAPFCTSEDLLVVCDGSRSGLVLDGQFGVIGSTLSVIHTPRDIQPFIKLIFLQGFQRMNSSMKGAAIPHLDTNSLLQEWVGLPPLEEQQRIVAKVDQLMAVCDRLQAQQDQRSTLTTQLRKATLDALANAQPGEELQAAWNRVNANLGLLFENPEDVEELKKCVLQNAVMGKLVEHNPEDEPAAVLLQKIAAEKAALVKKGVIKKEKPIPEIREDEKPFVTPKGWEFAHLQSLCSVITDGTHQTPKYTESGRLFVSAQCVKPFRFMPENGRFVSEAHYQEYIKGNKPEFHDILLSRVGAGIGEAALIDQKIDFAIYVSTGLIKPIKGCVLPEYIVLWLNSPIGKNFSERNTYGKGVSQGNLNLSLIRSFLVSLPPLPEQHRIVAKNQSLLAICDTLQLKIGKARAIAEQLAQGVVDSITGISSEKAEKMKAPKTELVSKLRLVKAPGKKDIAPLSEQLSKHQNEMSAKALWNASGLPIDEFYKQLKIEMANGWIDEPVKAEVRIVEG